MKSINALLDVAMPMDAGGTLGSSLPVIIIIVLVVAILVVAFVVINKRKNAAGKEESAPAGLPASGKPEEKE